MQPQRFELFTFKLLIIHLKLNCVAYIMWYWQNIPCCEYFPVSWCIYHSETLTQPFNNMPPPPSSHQCIFLHGSIVENNYFDTYICLNLSDVLYIHLILAHMGTSPHYATWPKKVRCWNSIGEISSSGHVNGCVDAKHSYSSGVNKRKIVHMVIQAPK